ncbi:hypothetical protein [Bdellovibrio sp. HCB274]|uniref:TolB family protein n=1 Tax=Bdellovibrio sp. HCB274 TaxID=3394361 RepID=UPI0039B60338
MKQLSLKIILLGSILFGCTHSPTKDLLTPDFLLQKNVKQVTFQGDNERPRFSANGTRLIYSSHHRGNRKDLQVYETDLIRNKERRVTFSDGAAFDADYINDMEIIYASTTDEIKESPFLNRNPDKDFPPADLYLSDRFGSDILRVTLQPGFDAEAFMLPHPTKPSVIFTSRRGDVTGIYRLDLKSRFVSLLASETGKDRRYPTLAPEKSRVAFKETNLESKQQSLQLVDLHTKQTALLKSGEGHYRDLFFAPRPPSRLFYSILRKGDKKYQIEVYNLETKCTQVVFKGKDDLLYPAVSNESVERLAFTRTVQEKKQIYLVNLPEDLGPCLPDTASTTKTEMTDTLAAAPVAPAPSPKPVRKRKPVVAAPVVTPMSKPDASATPIQNTEPTPNAAPPTDAVPTSTPTATPVEKPMETPAATPTSTPSVTPAVTPATSPVSVESPTPAPSPVK